MYSSVLVANRGEIALRVISTLQDHNIDAFVTSSDIDKHMLPARRADGILHLPGEIANETYLSIEKIVAGAVELQVDAIHPGYGFLSENAEFASEVINNGIDFIGPQPNQMKSFGDKIAARKIAEDAGVKIIPGSGSISDKTELFEVALQMGFPVLIKAAGGGGGRGIRLVKNKEDFDTYYEIAAKEAHLAFNDDRLYVEKFIPKGRHIEVQILGEKNGNVLPHRPTDSTPQRNNQPLIEESPAYNIPRDKVEEIHKAAVRLTEESKYENAGTVEFLVDNNQFYFLEVNARIQVEHPVTEFVTGEDLIWRQLQVSSGQELEISQQSIRFRGHAIEARIYAEDPYNGFLPSPGRVKRIIHPIGAGVRVDSAVEDGTIISPHYDPMISKVISYGSNRPSAIRKLQNILENYLILGVHTTIPFIKQLTELKEFSDMTYHTRFLEDHIEKIPDEIREIARLAAAYTFGGNATRSETPSSKNSRWKTTYFQEW